MNKFKIIIYFNLFFLLFISFNCKTEAKKISYKKTHFACQLNAIDGTSYQTTILGFDWKIRKNNTNSHIIRKKADNLPSSITVNPDIYINSHNNNDYLFYDFNSKIKTNGIIKIIDINGKTILQEDYNIFFGTNNFSLFIANLSPGVYLTYIEYSNSISNTIKFIK